MSKVQEVANINGYPLKDKQSREQIVKINEHIMNPQLADFVDCEVFAQVIGEKVGFNMTDFGVQSMAIGDNILCVGIANKNAGTGEQSKLIAYNITTGSVVAYKDNISIGHCNGMTYCTKDGYFYIACDGGKNGLNKVEVYDKSLNHIKTIDFLSYEYAHPYGIAWNERTESFYCIVDEARVAKLDYDFNLVEYHIIRNKPHSDLTAQTIFIADDYLFIIFNDNSKNIGNYNKMIVYNLDTMTLHKEQYVMLRLELEQCVYYNNQLYLLFNSQNSGLICKGSLYNDDYTGNYIPKYLFGGSQIPVESIIDEYYMDSNYTDFFVENTQAKPFNKLLVGVGYAIRSTVKEAIRFNVSGDFSETNIVIKHLPCNLRIEGYGSTKAKIGGVFIQNVGIATLKNFEIVKRSATENKLLGMRNVQYSWIDGLVFNGTGTEEDGLWLISSTAEIQNCEFKSDVTRNIIHCALNSYIALKDSNTITGSGVMYIPPECAISTSILYNDRTRTISEGVIRIPATTNFDITKIRNSGRYYLAGGSTSINVPNPIKAGGYVFEVNNNNDVIEYLVRQYNGWKCRGILEPATTDESGKKIRTIKWLGECYISEDVPCESSDYTTDTGLHVATTNLKEVTLFGSFKTGSASLSAKSLIAKIKTDENPSDTKYFKPRNTTYYFIGTSLSDGKSYILYVNNNEIRNQTALPAGQNFCVTGTYMLEDVKFTVSEG